MHIVFLRIIHQVSESSHQQQLSGQQQQQQHILTKREWLPLISETGLLNSESKVRLIVIQAIQLLHTKNNIYYHDNNDDDFDDNDHYYLECLLWYMRYDNNEAIIKIAAEIWNDYDHHIIHDSDHHDNYDHDQNHHHHHLGENWYQYLLPLLRHRYHHVRTCAAKAIAGAILDYHHHHHENNDNDYNHDDDASVIVEEDNGNINDSDNDNSTKVIKNLCDTFIQSLPQRNERAGMMMKNNIAPVILSKKSSAKLSSSSTSEPSSTTGRNKVNAYLDDHHSDFRIAISQVFATIGLFTTSSSTAALTNSSTSSTIANININNNDIKTLHKKTIINLLEFIINYGVIDINQDVRIMMLQAGSNIVSSNYGKQHYHQIMIIINKILQIKYNGDKNDMDSINIFDYRYTSCILFLGTLGKHLSSKNNDDMKVLINIIETLIQTLHTPSESIQKSIADCLTPLIQILKLTTVTSTAASTPPPTTTTTVITPSTTADILSNLLQQLLNECLNGTTYGERRGGAYGLSAIVKGLGISSLKQYEIIIKLKDACNSTTSSGSNSVNNKQGALFAFECLSDRLGLLFEPYIVSVIDIILKSFSHSSDHVREAAQITAKVIMNKLSAHGIKQILTPILQSLPEEPQWKSRQESIRLLGISYTMRTSLSFVHRFFMCHS